MASSPTVSSPSKSSKALPSQQSSATATSQHEKAHAIDMFPTPVAQTYSHIHPTILLALYSLRFSSLVADPVSTLWSDLPLYTALQTAYVVTCLPQAGSSHQHHSHVEAGSGEVADVKKTPSSSSGKRKRHATGNNKSDTLSQKLTVRQPFSSLLALLLASLETVLIKKIGGFHRSNINLRPRHTGPLPTPHPLRRPLYDAYRTYSPVCRAHGSTHRNATGIRPRRRRYRLETDLGICAPRRCRLGWCFGCLCGCLVWRCSDSVGLVRFLFLPFCLLRRFYTWTY